jgi:hypothetical protein
VEICLTPIDYTKSTKGIRDRVRIGRLANSLEDVNWFANTFMDMQGSDKKSKW